MTEEGLSQQELLSRFNSAVLSRSNEQVLRYGVALLARESNQKGARLRQNDLALQRCHILEQVSIESGLFGLQGWMVYCFCELRKQFPNSTRVKRLAGCLHEYLGDHDEAIFMYLSILSAHPEDVATRKRLIACLKSTARNADAIEYLNRHLGEFGVDQGAWLELAKIYESEGCFAQSLFCYEELVLQNPRNIFYVISYAEALASAGDYAQSMDYYTVALAIQQDCVRALWGLLSVSSMLESKDSKARNLEKNSAKESLVHLAGIRLRQIYESLEENDFSSICLKVLKDTFSV